MVARQCRSPVAHAQRAVAATVESETRSVPLSSQRAVAGFSSGGPPFQGSVELVDDPSLYVRSADGPAAIGTSLEEE
jgi:hypothetical protein